MEHRGSATETGRRRNRVGIAAFAVAGLAVGPVFAADGAGDRGLLDQRVTVSAGTFLLSTDMRLRINGAVGTLGTDIDLEKDFGIRPGDRFRVDLNWRIAGRHRLRALYFDYGAEATRSISRDIVIRDRTFPASATVTAGFSTEILELAYEYALVQRENWDLLGTLGAHLLRFTFSASGEVRIGNVSAGTSTERVSTEAPLPVVGLRHLWRMSDKWYLETQGQYFKASINGYRGDITDLRAGVNWMFSEHVGLGFGYSSFQARVNTDLHDFRGRVDWGYSGPQIYLVASF